MADKLRKNDAGGTRRSADRKGSDRRRNVAGIVLMVAGLIVLLSVLSYSIDDEVVLEKFGAVDVLRLPFDKQAQALASGINNHLGPVGALIANFFVLDTTGFSSVVFPLLMIMWGWVMLRGMALSRPITVTNYAIAGTLEFSTAAGVANLIAGGITKEWSGVAGAFLADVLVHLIGRAGAAIVVVAGIAITVVLATDLDIRRVLERLAAAWADMRARPAVSQRGGSGEAEIAGGEVMIHRTDDEIPHHKSVEPLRRMPEAHPAMAPPEPFNEPVEVSLMAEERSEDVAEQDAVKTSTGAADESEEIDYVFPSVDLLDAPRQSETVPEDELKANAELVRTKLANFGVQIDNVSVTPGPVVTLYELVPAEGVKVSRIVSLADDLALALAAKGIRIMAPIPGKSAVGVEIPNRNPTMVYLRSVLNSGKYRELKANLPLAMGKTISGEVYTDDLARMPHLLIAGSTGSGKSVGINTILASLLFRLHPSDVKFIIIDPKKIEMNLYAKLNHHFLAASPDLDEEIITTPENAVGVLRSVEIEMEKRYDRLASAGVRNIQDYNERWKAGRLRNSDTVVHRKMAYLIVVIDELADLMMTAAREVEEPIARLAQLARAVGVHLVLATQRPSVDVITGVIKANFPARIAYQVASKTDSRTILDMNGAEQLLGSGDMLYLPAGSPKPVRIQSAFISTEEVERLTDHIARQQGYAHPFQLPSLLDRKRAGAHGVSDSRDEFFEEAARLIVRHQQGSVSLLQRRLKVGYSRAARLVDELEAAGIVGPFDGSKAREVLVENDAELNQILTNL